MGNELNVNSVAVAKEWLKLGIRPIPIRPGQKKPRGSSWQKLRLTTRTVQDYFQPNDNVGGLWGKPSNWIVDVDFDDEGAADLGELLLPKTFTFGRESRPQTHYLYYCKGAKTQKWVDAKKHALVELRSTGSQTVLPPSVHPDKERYCIDDPNDDEFTALARVKLVRYLNQIAAGALLIRHFPDKGSRHDYVHAVAGALLWSRWKPEDVRRFVRAIVRVTRDNDDDPQQRMRTIDNTIEHHKQGHRIAGWKTLKDFVPNTDLQLIRRWLEDKDSFEPLPKTATPTFSDSQLPRFDESLLEVPGLVGQLIEWSGKQTYLEQPAFDLATALMCTAVASCNHYQVDAWDTPLQPYFMLLAPTAAGKAASLDRVYEFANQIGIGKSVHQHFQSYHALMDELAEPPHMACWLWDEAARHLRTARSASSQEFQILSHLISLYGRANKFVPGAPGRKNPIPALNNPFLTLFATAQPSQLVEAISQTDLATGFVNRFVLFDSGDKFPQRNARRTNIFPSTLKKQGKMLRSHEPKKERTIIRFSNTETFGIFDDFAEKARRRIRVSENNEMWGRANQNALILAGIVAVGVDPNRPVITADIAEWALRLITWSIESWMLRVDDLTVSTFRESYSKRVESIIRNPAALITPRTRQKQRSLLEQGVVPKSILTAKCRGLQSREIDDIIDQLLVIGLIGQSEQDDGTVVYWPKR